MRLAAVTLTTAATANSAAARSVASAALVQVPEQGATSTPVAKLSEQLAAMTAVTGYEQAVADSIRRMLPGARRDRAGNTVLMLGTGEPRRLVACPLDEPGYVVSGIRPDGYLTLRAAPGRVPPLFDQQLEGHRITVYGTNGPVPGVVGVRSIHLTRNRDAADEPFSIEDAYVDIGASTAIEVRRLGIRMLAPVTLTKRPHRYGAGAELLAAPAAASRTACAALVVAAREMVTIPGTIKGGTTVIAFTVEERLSGRGLAALSHTVGPFRETLVVGAASGAAWPRLGAITRRSLPARYAGTPVETVSLIAADSLRADLRRWIGGNP